MVLKANETAIIDSTVAFDWAYNWINILYQQGTNDFVNMSLGLGITDGTMHLSGPGTVMLNPNDVSIGTVGLRVVRQNASEHYYTIAHPVNRLVLNANETAIIDSTVGFDTIFNGMNILYQHGTK